MKLKKILFCISTVLLSASLLLTGCMGNNDSVNDNLVSNNAASNNDVQSEAQSGESNNEGFPIVAEKLTITVAGGYGETNGSDWNEKETIQEIEEKTNIHADWQLTPKSGWAEKQNLLFASGDLPDVVLNLNLNNIVKYGSQGLLIPMEDLIKEHAPNLSKIFNDFPDVRKLVTAPDGHIYVLPRVNLDDTEVNPGNNLWINKKWLENVGMDMPTTTEEFSAVLEAFKNEDANGNGDPNDEIPLSFQFKRSNNGIEGFIFGSFGTINSARENTVVRDGKVEYVPATPQYKEGIKYLHSLYAKGLIDVEVFSLTGAQYTAKLSKDTPIVGAIVGASPDHLVDNPETRWDYELVNPPLMGPDGHQMKSMQFHYLNRRAVGITVANEHPVETIRWLDQFYDEEMSYKLKYGPNAIKKNADGTWEQIPPAEGYNLSQWSYKESPVNDFIYAITTEMAEKLVKPDIDHKESRYTRPEFTERVKPYFKPEMRFPLVLYSEQEQKDLDRYSTDIQKYVEQKTAEWVTKGGIEEEWDDYMKQLEKSGLDEMVKIYQEVYDRYQAS